jgi:lipopolysaccharide transport system ATP-binding protein
VEGWRSDVQPAISIEDVSKRFVLGSGVANAQLREALLGAFRRKREPDDATTLWALRNISLSIEPGEVVGFIGRNGAGKSTLLKVVSRITYPTEGRIRVAGRVASLLEVGTGFHEELTGRENVYLNGSILGMTHKQVLEKFDEIVAFADVERFIDTPIKRYSSGMRLRLGFAVAAHLESDILIVDEVLAVGDAEFQKKCLGAMSALHGGGRTVLFVSHNMAAVENLCTRCVWIDGGRIRMDGDTPDVISAYMASYSSGDDDDRDLTKAENRKGNGDLRFTAMRYLTPDGAPKGVVRSGEALKVELSFQVNKRVVMPHFGVSVHSDVGTLVTESSTYNTGADTASLDLGPGKVEFTIANLNLMPGRYFLSFWSASLGKLSYDRLEHCCKLDVEVADIYGTGRGIDKRHGLMFLPMTWRVTARP